MEEKLSKVIEWWVWDLDNIVDENIHLNAMKEIPIETRVYFRNGVDILMKVINEFSIDYMVVSAGIGDIVKYSFEHLFNEIGLKPFDISLVSNFGIYDENQRLCGFRWPLIHSFNKEEILKNKYYLKFPNKMHDSAIVMGDIIQDSLMLKHIPIQNQLKIGFLNNMKKQESQLPLFQSHYDLIIIGDGNLWPVLQILDYVHPEIKLSHYLSEFGNKDLSALIQ